MRAIQLPARRHLRPQNRRAEWLATGFARFFERRLDGNPDSLDVASNGRLGVRWRAFVRHEKMAYTLRGGGSLDSHRAVGGGASTEWAGDWDRQTVASGQSAAAIGHRPVYGRSSGPRRIALGVGWRSELHTQVRVSAARHLADPMPHWVGVGLDAGGCRSGACCGVKERWKPVVLGEK